jgi:hypothetical protein
MGVRPIETGMRVTRAAAFVLFGIAWAASATGQGKSYMMLVGDLVGAVETPRLIQEVCGSRFPKRRTEFADAYSQWRARHEDVLKAIDEQVARANVRLERQGAPPGASVVTTINGILQRRFDTLDAAGIRQLCGAYPQTLKAKDEEMKSSVPTLLEVVADADRQMSAKELTRPN